MTKKKIRTLIVDDSLLFRETLVKEIGKDKSIEIVGSAKDPYEARDMIIKHRPDVLILDVYMPKMNGIEFLKKLMPQYPMPVVVMSSVSKNVFEALQAGAVDFVTKPDLKATNFKSFISELKVKVKVASVSSVKRFRHKKNKHVSNKKAKGVVDIIAIGASTGGTEAIYEVIKDLPENTPGVVIVQHMPPVFTRMYAERLNDNCYMKVKEATTGDKVEKGTVLIAPGGYHMKLRKTGKMYSVECVKGESVNGHCPSVEVLFNSVAEKAKARAIGVILTGMGGDGAKGMLRMKEAGSYNIGQTKETCVVYGMPKVAYEIGAVHEELELDKISARILEML